MARDKFVNPIEIAKLSSTPANSSSGYTLLYPKNDGFLYMKDGAGNETQIGPLTYVIGNKTATYAPTAVVGIEVIRCDCSGGAFNINLPTAAGSRAIFVIVKTDASANNLTVDANAAETIVLGLTAVLKVQQESIILISNNVSNWDII